VREGDAAFEALLEAIDTLAAQQAPELVAEARAEAMAKVRSMLAEAIAQSLLDHSAASLSADREAGRSPSETHPTRRSRTPRSARRRTQKRAAEPRRRRTSDVSQARPAEPPTPRAAEPSPREAEQGYYVYGVVSASAADLPADLAGVDPHHPAMLVEDGGLAAIVSRVSLAEFGEEQLHDNLNDVAWLEDKARAHEEVLDGALSRMTVVPMRLCTIYRTEDQLHEMLAAERDLLLDALERLHGRTEWGVKLIAEPGALERAATSGGVADEPGADGAASEGAAYLNRKRHEARAREAADRVAEEWTEAVHDRLAAKASEALLNPLQNPEVSGHTGEMLLNGVYLVEDGDAEDFRRLVDQLASEYQDLGAAVELTGPWPPYNFVKSSIEAAR
jgi:hypothetical protein